MYKQVILELCNCIRSLTVEIRALVREQYPEVENFNDRCDHSYMHIDTSRHEKDKFATEFNHHSPWIRIDRFYCKKCLEMKTIRQELHWAADRPDWF